MKLTQQTGELVVSALKYTLRFHLGVKKTYASHFSSPFFLFVSPFPLYLILHCVDFICMNLKASAENITANLDMK